MLEAPPTLRLPRPDEIPYNPETFERIKQRETANIIEGFNFKYNSPGDRSFKFYAEINIDNSRLWKLFKTLANNMPENLSCIYNLFEQELFQSNISDKNLVLTLLDKYKIELAGDCFLEFGLIYQGEIELEEIFVSESKYIKYWGSNENYFRQIMHDFNINEIADLNFYDEFPKVVEPLTMFNKQAKNAETVIDELNDFFSIKN
jgi:hypothetical protein